MPLVGGGFKRVKWIVAAICVIVVHGVLPVQAQGTAISQAFEAAESNLEDGSLVSLKKNSNNTVEFANSERVDELVGVVAKDSLIELSEAASSIQVVTSGVTLALVSDISGDVKTGDKVTASPIDGVGMKVEEDSYVVGTAQADLSSVKLAEHTIQDAEGKNQVVHVGMIPVQVNVTFYALPENSATFMPAFLQSFANAIAGRQVSAVRVLVAFVALLLAFVSIAVLLYSSVRSSIISIGRNPLSEVAVRKSLYQIGATVIGILLLTLITIYLILIT